MPKPVSPTPPQWSGREAHQLVAFEPQAMTNWYLPAQLASTALDVAVSTTVGRHADPRILESLGMRPAQIFDYSQLSSLTFDFAADTGDGWDSTYTLASHLAQDQLAVQLPGGKAATLGRGRFLVLGGDEVYPTASRAYYERRLISPFETAMAISADEESAPHLFAVPGNHDWYDSLTSFTRLFVAKGWLGAWRCRQERSYFAVRLPHGWWLVGVDVQLDSDLDEPQLRYFQEVAQQIGPEDRIILCLPEPHWVFQQERDTGHWDRAEWERCPPICPEGERPIITNLDFLEHRLFKHQVWVTLAGDLHHYRRHQTPEGRQKIVAGGGGAFLHPTHVWSETPLKDGSIFQKAWPDPGPSRKLAWRNLLFPFLHWRLGLLVGLFYLMVDWTVHVDLSSYAFAELGPALSTALGGTLQRPGAALIVLGLLGAFVLFAAPEKRWFRWSAGLVHGLAHLGLCFSLGWWATWLSVVQWELPFSSPLQHLLAGVLVLGAGAILGTMLWGVYLFVSLNVFKYHWTEAFSGLAIPDWKHFLRLRIDESGDLTIFPLGFRRVPRRWKPGPASPTGPRLEPDDPDFTPAQLIEAPILVPRRQAP